MFYDVFCARHFPSRGQTLGLRVFVTTPYIILLLFVHSKMHCFVVYRENIFTPVEMCFSFSSLECFARGLNAQWQYSTLGKWDTPPHFELFYVCFVSCIIISLSSYRHSALLLRTHKSHHCTAIGNSRKSRKTLLAFRVLLFLLYIYEIVVILFICYYYYYFFN